MTKKVSPLGLTLKPRNSSVQQLFKKEKLKHMSVRRSIILPCADQKRPKTQIRDCRPWHPCSRMFCHQRISMRRRNGTVKKKAIKREQGPIGIKRGRERNKGSPELAPSADTREKKAGTGGKKKGRDGGLIKDGVCASSVGNAVCHSRWSWLRSRVCCGR